MKEYSIEEYVYALLEKSEEAYLMALEVINKPTIKYRTEAFCFFMCNAWELALKAFIIKQKNSIDAINFKNKPSQTIGLEECMKKVFVSTTDVVKANLNVVREIRNKATHNILPDYDFKFASLFQRCVYNFTEFIKKHFQEYKINNQVTAFVALSNLPSENNSPLSLNPYALVQLKRLEEGLNASDVGGNITQTVQLLITKKPKEADLKLALDNSADKTVEFVDVPKDFNKTHPYRQKEIVEMVKETLILSYGKDFGFNQHKFQIFCKDKNIKAQKRYCFSVKVDKNPRYMYSRELIDIILLDYLENKKD